MIKRIEIGREELAGMVNRYFEQMTSAYNFLKTQNQEGVINSGHNFKEYMVRADIFSQFDEINFLDKDMFEKYKYLQTRNIALIANEYVFNRLHKEFPNFSCTFEDFLTFKFTLNMYESLDKVIEVLSEHSNGKKEKGKGYECYDFKNNKVRTTRNE